jgi:ABC-type antimicrobial peptide transport system permease subunit
MIEIKGQAFEVVGLLEHYERMQGDMNILDGKNEIIFIPITTAMLQFRGDPELNFLNVRIQNVDHLADAMGELRNILWHTHRGIQDFKVSSNEEMVGSLSTMRNNFLVVGISIGAITLLVGGIGITNLMLASVNERIREIGIRKAVGARNLDIFLEFLAESVALSLIGGLGGVGLGVGVILLLQGIGSGFVSPEISLMAVVVGFGFSVVVGLVSGLYPAWHAAKLDPIESLRYE